MNFSELLEKLEKSGCNFAEVTIGRMMDIVEEETGKFPNWNEKVPEWILRNCGIKL